MKNVNVLIKEKGPRRQHRNARPVIKRDKPVIKYQLLIRKDYNHVC
jgi:hypothetical protein